MNRKGQALVEFVLILPVFILIVFAFIDVGKIILCKNSLQGSLNDVVLMYRNGDSIRDINLVINNNSDYDINVNVNGSRIVLKTKIDLITPGMSKIFSENIVVERSILYE